MRNSLALSLTLALLTPFAESQSTDATPTLTGHWTAVIDYYGTHANFGFDLTQQGDKLTGKVKMGIFGSAKLSGGRVRVTQNA